jgi:monovalent cation/proton antiporter MnhG/PhaG subunit
MSLREVLVDVFLVSGVALVLISCLGVAVFREAYDRLHYGAPSALGAILIAVAVVIKESFSLVGDKAILVAAVLLVMAPIVTHAIGRAARTAEHGDWTLRPGEQIEVEEQSTR